jgi:hypothetical protein
LWDIARSAFRTSSPSFIRAPFSIARRKYTGTRAGHGSVLQQKRLRIRKRDYCEEAHSQRFAARSV